MDNPEKLATYLGYSWRRKQKHNPICVVHQYTQQQKHKNKTWTLLQTTGGKDEPSIFLCGNRSEHHNLERKDT